MTLLELQSLLGWCALLNMGILLYWAGFILLAHDWVYKMHSRWFNIGESRFDEIHYMAMAFYKLVIFMFMITPYVALRIMG